MTCITTYYNIVSGATFTIVVDYTDVVTTNEATTTATDKMSVLEFYLCIVFVTKLIHQ